MPTVVRIATSEAQQQQRHHRTLDPGAGGEIGRQPQERESAAGEARSPA